MTFPLKDMYSWNFLLEESEIYVYMLHIFRHLKLQINVLISNILHRNKTIWCDLFACQKAIR